MEQKLCKNLCVPTQEKGEKSNKYKATNLVWQCEELVSTYHSTETSSFDIWKMFCWIPEKMTQIIDFVILIILTTLILCCAVVPLDQPTDEPVFTSLRQRHRVRRLTGFRTKCLPKKKKFCSIFTHKGISKTFCLNCAPFSPVRESVEHSALPSMSRCVPDSISRTLKYWRTSSRSSYWTKFRWTKLPIIWLASEKIFCRNILATEIQNMSN